MPQLWKPGPAIATCEATEASATRGHNRHTNRPDTRQRGAVGQHGGGPEHNLGHILYAMRREVTCKPTNNHWAHSPTFIT